MQLLKPVLYRLQGDKVNQKLCTICPDNKNVIIYYKLKEKENEDNENEKNEEKSKSNYKKSKMRVEFVKLCKKYRKSTKN